MLFGQTASDFPQLKLIFPRLLAEVGAIAPSLHCARYCCSEIGTSYFLQVQVKSQVNSCKSRSSLKSSGSKSSIKSQKLRSSPSRKTRVYNSAVVPLYNRPTLVAETTNYNVPTVYNPIYCTRGRSCYFANIVRY